MGHDELLAHLQREQDAFAACLAGDLAAPVEHCGTWTLHDLAEHLGGSSEWVVAAVDEGRLDYQAPAAPRGREELVAWFARACAAQYDALAQDPLKEVWTVWPPNNIGFWRRRRCLETLVHRWDAEHALGIVSVLDPALCAEGVAEVVDMVAPREVALGRAPEPTSSLRLRTADTGESWVLGPGTPAATVSGLAADLLLAVWHRLPPDAPSLAWEGDAAAGRALLSGRLVP